MFALLTYAELRSHNSFDTFELSSDISGQPETRVIRLNPAELHFKAKMPNSHRNLLSSLIHHSRRMHEFQKHQGKDSEQPQAVGLHL